MTTDRTADAAPGDTPAAPPVPGDTPAAPPGTAGAPAARATPGVDVAEAGAWDISPDAVRSAWRERLRSFREEAPAPRRVQLRRTSDALRRILHRLHSSRAEASELAPIADELERLAATLESLPSRSMYEGVLESTLLSQDPHVFFDHSPMLGEANPLAPPVRLREEDGVIRAMATFGPAYEGPPGCVHGGYVAAAFDEVLGATQSLGGRPGMTGRLSIDYRSPTPLNTELDFEGRLERVEGRKTFVLGTLHAGDRLCAEAQGLFVAIDFRKMLELRRQREERLGPDGD
jgi:acyl-coenzyme A thioesterase PaaI-like protein